MTNGNEPASDDGSDQDGISTVAERLARTRLIPAMARGFRNRCPHCGRGQLFGRYLKVHPACTECGLTFDGHRADDLPPYITIFVVGHIIGYLILEIEMGYVLPLWVSVSVWPLLTLVLAFALLQPIKGAVVGLQYALAMHGFGRLPGAAADSITASPDLERDSARDGSNKPGSPVPRLGRI